MALIDPGRMGAARMTSQEGEFTAGTGDGDAALAGRFSSCAAAAGWGLDAMQGT